MEEESKLLLKDRFLNSKSEIPLKNKNNFKKNKDIEFIRACNATLSKEKGLNSKATMYWFFDKKNFWRRCLNRMNLIFNIKTRKGYIKVNNYKYHIYWGAAQWALTGECVKYIINFFDTQEKFNDYFKYVFPVDETYFHTIIFNSKFSEKTTFGGPETEDNQVTNWRNLHYFEYPKHIKVFTEKDFDLIKSKSKECIFIRKTNSVSSKKLLDMIDNELRERYS